MPALSAARGVPGVKDQTPLAGNFAVFLRSAPPRRDRASVALGLHAACIIVTRVNRSSAAAMAIAARRPRATEARSRRGGAERKKTAKLPASGVWSFTPGTPRAADNAGIQQTHLGLATCPF